MTVKDLAELISSIGTAMWPLLAFVALLWLVPKLLGRDNLNIEVGGFKISFSKAVSNISEQIKDIREKIVDLENRVAGAPKSEPLNADPSAAGEEPKHIKILWVDDVPVNNAFVIASLDKERFTVTLATSTADALVHLTTGKFDISISDMGRVEGGRNNPSAGLDFLRILAERGIGGHKAIYSSTRAATRYGAEARKLGAELVTSSPTDLLAFISRVR